MKQNKMKRLYKSSSDLGESDLTAALDESVRAAVVLGVSERVLVTRMLCSLRAALRTKIVQLPTKTMYDSSAGP
ncbi:MAG TPA: hypothetical protein V6C81_19005 [Planktothrix sp.]|jgi:hypothetical protein